ncbi:HNH endonuclease [Rhizobium sp. CFBP 8762]|nr:HNH endonuclease [Rhizobium sp. CFBP 8762]
MAWLKNHSAMVIGEYHSAFNANFQREDVTPQNLHALRKRMGWKTGRTGHFVKGQVSPNKGTTCAPGTGGRHPNAQRTQFKKGRLPHNHQGAGHERIDRKDGYTVMIIDEVNPWTGAATRPVHKHRYLWEQANGPIPDGYVLKCLDGDKMNCAPSNWEAIPRGVLPRLNGGRSTRVMAYDTAPDELKPALLTLARVDQKASELRKRKGTRLDKS